MREAIFGFIKRYDSFILTTHDPADADGLGAELVFARVLKNMEKEFRVINASPVPEAFWFMDPEKIIEQWDEVKHRPLLKKSALVMLDTADEYTLGVMKDVPSGTREVFAIDHHEPKPHSAITGLIDQSSAAASELAVEIAASAGVPLDQNTARAAYAGIVYDTGFFAYSKTSLRTFRAAHYLAEQGANPYEVYQALCENASTGSLLLQKKVLGSLELHAGGRIAAQILRKEDLTEAGARFEDAESFANAPLRAKEIAVSILVKESPEGKVRCSLRSKGAVNVSKIAQEFGGGGHVSAAGFRSAFGVEETLERALAKAQQQLEKI
ncbi:MAG: bifunctional oligoribonuclease/PAP phosphatase NrnA [Treponema sp.]|jgi:phosphoesterase RecJ-like protein|nr:bifunctional oligoribonuclease/PAP phosphatase NrnA [Treponema sp.]